MVTITGVDRIMMPVNICLPYTWKDQDYDIKDINRNVILIIDANENEQFDTLSWIMFSYTVVANGNIFKRMLCIYTSKIFWEGNSHLLILVNLNTNSPLPIPPLLPPQLGSKQLYSSLLRGMERIAKCLESSVSQTHDVAQAHWLLLNGSQMIPELFLNSSQWND